MVAFLTAWKALDADQIAQTYADDGLREDITTPTIIQGRDDVRRSLVAFLGAFSNAMVEHPVAFAASNAYAADTWVFTGNYTGLLPGLPPGTGELVTIHGFTLIEIDNGSIRRTVDYYDAYGLLVQVGAAAPQAAGRPKVATPAD
ncbi:MAG: ester cyclase [Chloroflexota bacterium]|nr:ester cyclase [Chloroflexota bacterium]